MKIIGIVGKKRSGKDTVADYLVQNYGYIKLSFASPLKEIIKTLFDFDDEQINGNEKEIIDDYWNITPRRAMEYIGTNVFRKNISELIPNIGENFWSDILYNKCKKISEKNNDVKIVISDVRFIPLKI